MESFVYIVDPADLVIELVPNPNTGAWSRKLVTGIRITHMPSRLSAEFDDEKSPHRSKMRAMEWLQTELNKRYAPVLLKEQRLGTRFSYLHDSQDDVFVLLSHARDGLVADWAVESAGERQGMYRAGDEEHPFDTVKVIVRD